MCEHNHLFPMGTGEIIGSIVTGIIVGLANAGGIGGGPLMVALLFGIFNYTLKASI